MQTYTVNTNDSGQRLDKFIKKVMPTLPQSLMYKGIRTNAVRINGKRCRDGSVILNDGDTVALYFNNEFIAEKKPSEKLPFPEIIYEDENIIVINKPAGIPVHADDKGSRDTLINRILYYLEQKKDYIPENEHSFTPALCNRLDRNTSGLVIAAKNAQSLRIINEKIKLREIDKYYHCICDGIFEIKEQTVTSSLIREEKKVRLSDSEEGKEIRTHYKVISEHKNKSELEIKLLTGRTHQIRAQMAKLGHPLSGDTKYGGSNTGKPYSLTSFRLVFSFTSDAGILNYLKGKEIKIQFK